MASMKEIKRRKESIASTQQITKAMQLVSTVKLQRSKGKAETIRPYVEGMYDMAAAVLLESDLQSGPFSKKAVIVITSNRGLAGGYNHNVVKLITGDERLKKEEIEIYTLGKKGWDTFVDKGYTIAEDWSHVLNSPAYSDAKALGQRLLERFEKKEIGEIYLAYTVFQNTVTHVPTMLKLLPVEGASPNVTSYNVPMNYAPNEEEVLAGLLPKYIASMIYGAMTEAIASENGARMQAMDLAANNAEEMIQKLSLEYNRARQGSITQELTEIIAGAQAIS